MNQQKIQPKVLVVDDDPMVRNIITVNLKGAGLEPIEADSGESAWRLLTNGEHHFSAAIVDRMMPNMDGTSLTKRIKSNPAFACVPVIMLTSAAERAEMIDAVQGGVFDFLLKPVEPDLLLMVLKRAIGF
jgi:DNA-binding response OmpR family regulator